MRGSPFPHNAASAHAVLLRLKPLHAKALRRKAVVGSGRKDAVGQAYPCPTAKAAYLPAMDAVGLQCVVRERGALAKA